MPDQDNSGMNSEPVNGLDEVKQDVSEDLVVANEVKVECDEVETEAVHELSAEATNTTVVDVAVKAETMLTKAAPRNDGYSTTALDPAMYSMLSMFVKQKITKEKPHFCMYCGKQFVSGSGLYIHYYCHQSAAAASISGQSSQASTPKEPKKVQKTRSKDVATVVVPAAVAVKKKPTIPKARKVVVNGKTTVSATAKLPSAKVFSTSTADVPDDGLPKQPTTSTYVKPFPTKVLPVKTLRMLQELLRQKITPENPHLCIVCQHPFHSGCGIYIHYLKHAKKSIKASKKAVDAKSSSLANARQRIRKKRGTSAAAPARVRGPSPTSKAHMVPAKPVLDTKTLLMLRDIATRISPEDPHVCDICEHAFYNARGIQAHYLKHAKEKLLGAQKKVNVDVPPSAAAGALPVASGKKRSKATTNLAATLKPKGQPKKQQQSAIALDPTKKPSPLHWLRPPILHMLQGVVKGKISDDNPHTCTFCPKVFLRGTGLYFHYLQHKEATRYVIGMNVSPKKATPSARGVNVKNKLPKVVRPLKLALVAKASLAKTKAAAAKTFAAPKTVSVKVPAAVAVPHIAASNVPSTPPRIKPQSYAVKSLSHHSPTAASSTASPQTTTATSETSDMTALTGRKRDCTFLLRQLEHNTKKLLYHLTKDVQVLQSFGWPQKDASSIVDDILAACNVTPMRRSSQYPSRKLECLRSNVQKLIKFCIRDEVMVAKGWKDKLVDDAVKEIIAAEGFSGHDQERVTF